MESEKIGIGKLDVMENKVLPCHGNIARSLHPERIAQGNDGPALAGRSVKGASVYEYTRLEDDRSPRGCWLMRHGGVQ